MDFVEQLKSAIDIAQVIGEYVRLNKAGVARYKGLCPFHTEKTPSFNVDVVKQFYHCFGCKAGGDVIKFVMEMEGVTFYEALQQLADRHGIPMPKRAQYSDAETKLREALQAMHEQAALLYRQAFLGASGAEARAYVDGRGIAPAVAEEFGIGFAERGGQLLARRFEQEGFSPDAMEKSGLVIRRQEGGFFDRFRGRLMFPIHNEPGKIVAFAGRALASADEPKYLNSPETEIYKKKNLLYNLHRARPAVRKQERTILVEGYMDVIGLWAAGVHEVVASCGTALTSTQVRLMKRHAEQVVVNFDPDAAGDSAAERSIQTLLEESARVRILELDHDLDPDEYVRKFGVEQYRSRLERAANYFHWLADRARKKFDMRSGEGRAQAFQFLLPAIQRIPDKIERVAIANDVAGYLGVEAGLVLEQFRKAAIDRREKTVEARREPARPVERMLFSALLTDPQARAQAAPRLRTIDGWKGWPSARILEALLALEESRPGFGYADLDARLEDQDRALLAELAFADEITESVPHGNAVGRQLDPGSMIQACLKTLDDDARRAKMGDLRARLKAAERERNMEEAFRLMAEIDSLTRGGAAS